VTATSNQGELDRHECLRLLAAYPFGRVVFTDAALPAAQPVHYLLDKEEIIFRAANGSKLASATRHAVIGFQLDHIDVATRSGWSVLGVGQAYEIVDAARLDELTPRLPALWGPSRLAHTIAIPLQQLTGRRLEAVTLARNGPN
jgi:nitroimidazol reductase NimA-like FMN-containing flavoprotein (pyridoxamine 5'-phosphate oxidase superfamily)